MLRGSDLPAMMTRVETALAKAARSGASGAIFVAPHGDGELGIPSLRRAADVDLLFASGSDRLVVGPVVRLVKRGVRRGLRWYLDPMTEQQTRFNHAVLDLVEKLRLQNERLLIAIDALRREVDSRAAAAVNEAEGDPATLPPADEPSG